MPIAVEANQNESQFLLNWLTLLIPLIPLVGFWYIGNVIIWSVGGMIQESKKLGPCSIGFSLIVLIITIVFIVYLVFTPEFQEAYKKC